MIKSKLRKKILKVRKEKNKKNIKFPFSKIFQAIKKNITKKKVVGGYYPVNFEADVWEFLKKLETKGLELSLPVVKKIIKWIFTAGLTKIY